MSGYNIAIYIIKMNAMTTVIILRSIWGGRVCTFMIAWLVNVVFTNNSKQIVPCYAYYLILKLSITDSL